jgi:transcriptional regulator with XRE-family HTH domain
MSYTEAEFYKYVGEKVSIARRAAGKNQRELAKDVELQRTSITNIESGQQKTQIYTLYRIAEALHIPILSLLPPQPEIEKSETNKEDLVSRQEMLVDEGRKRGLSEAEIKDILKVLE